MRDATGVDRIGLGKSADGTGELADLTWVDDGDRQDGFGQGGGR
jgi:hypothetical protein